MIRLRPADVMVSLRRHGIVVHHAAPDTRGPGVVVFLEANLGQHELARDVVLRLPGVVRVRFVGDTPTVGIMRVTGRG